MPTANVARLAGLGPLFGAEALTGPESPIGWVRSRKPVPYPQALTAMESRVAEIGRRTAPETVWLLEHPALYTAGTSAAPEELLDPDRFPVYRTGRGGRYTYHGPGQRICYLMLDLKARGGDVRAFVQSLEEWIMAMLATFGLEGERHPGEVGIWVNDAKIAAIGIRVRQGITFHGISVNVSPELEHFSGIVPCGLKDARVTSLKALGAEVSLQEVDAALQKTFPAALAA